MGWMTIPHILNFPWNIYQHLPTLTNTYQHLPTFTNMSLQNHPGLWLNRLNLPWSMGSLQAAPKPPHRSVGSQWCYPRLIKHGQLENPPFSSMIVPSKPWFPGDFQLPWWWYTDLVSDVWYAWNISIHDDDVWCVMPRWDKQKPAIFTDWYNGITYRGHVYRYYYIII